MTTREVADYLRLKERKVYDLVRQGAMPSVRFSGKLLFPRSAIDLWVLSHLEGDQARAAPPPPVYAGSSDPLLQWALREAGTELAQLCHGSGDGVARLLNGHAQLIGLHVVNPASGGFNEPAHCGLGGLRDLVMLRWATRRQGLVLPAGNPRRITGIGDLAAPELRVVHRQRGAGAEGLLHHLLTQAGIDPGSLDDRGPTALDEDDLAAEVGSGRADCGLAVEASARRHGLDFIPLAEERFDLALRRRSYFEPPMQRLMAFVRTDAFREKAAEMGGYDVNECGAVRYNA
ncbi:helix-turn-helix transcriptional regulator [Spiribacter halobius]|nr:helix-turn-helix transcriptional regulator [Spiribacter halobius]UEX77181.1 helix-turn-helix transcriptional regulator [Spiribacter halobius]